MKGGLLVKVTFEGAQVNGAEFDGLLKWQEGVGWRAHFGKAP
jgi:hypothetical protein